MEKVGLLFIIISGGREMEPAPAILMSLPLSAQLT